MRVDHPIQDFAESITKALAVDLPEIEYEYRAPGAKREPGQEPEIRKRRPTQYDIRDIHCFYETWGSTALGFGGMGGAAMTTALTVVIFCGSNAAVYWNGAFAYLVPKEGVPALRDDMNEHRTRDRRDAVKMYLATFPDMEKWIKTWTK